MKFCPRPVGSSATPPSSAKVKTPRRGPQVFVAVLFVARSMNLQLIPRTLVVRLRYKDTNFLLLRKPLLMCAFLRINLKLTLARVRATEGFNFYWTGSTFGHVFLSLPLTKMMTIFRS